MKYQIKFKSCSIVDHINNNNTFKNNDNNDENVMSSDVLSKREKIK